MNIEERELREELLTLPCRFGQKFQRASTLPSWLVGVCVNIEGGSVKAAPWQRSWLIEGCINLVYTVVTLFVKVKARS